MPLKALFILMVWVLPVSWGCATTTTWGPPSIGKAAKREERAVLEAGSAVWQAQEGSNGPAQVQPPPPSALLPLSPAEDEQLEQSMVELLHAVYPEALQFQSVGTITPASVKVTSEVAVKVLENISRGEHAFKPELGKNGGCSWFVSEGNPHVGVNPAKKVELPVKLMKPAEVVHFSSEALVEIRNEELRKLAPVELEAEYRKYHNIPTNEKLTRKQQRALERFARRLAERRMWDEVGRRVSQSAAKVGEVILKNSEFSKSADGKFLVVADAARLQVEGGVSTIVQALEKSGVKAEPVLVEAAEQMAHRLRWAGKVKTAFRYGGRVIIVVAIAADVYMIYKAQDRVKAVVRTVGGWAGAVAASSLFATYFSPVNAAGPAGWAIYGVGVLVSGGVGYWVVSESTTTVYELVLE